VLYSNGKTIFKRCGFNTAIIENSGSRKIFMKKFPVRPILLIAVFFLIAALTGCMSIHTAARNGNITEVKKQLAWGANPNSRTFWYLESPLHEAARGGYPEIVKLLLEKGAQVNIRNEGGATPLHYAARNGNIEVMEILLENGADVTQKGTGCGTALQWAARNGQIQAIKTLMSNGVDINQRGSDDVTALMDAVSNGQLETVEFLIANGADINARTARDSRCSALSIAAGRNNVEIGQLLLQHGADPTLECNGRKIPQSFIEKLRN